MKIVLKRICAYLIDIILVSLVATLISSNSYINKDYKKYQKAYDEYNSKYENYNNYYAKLEKCFHDEEISKEEYDELLEMNKQHSKDLIIYYDDEKIENNEYEKIIENLSLEYSNIEINYSYKLLKYSTIPTIISLMCILLYFVVIQFCFDGKTLGKKIMKLKVVSNNDKKLNILNFLLRSLIVNEVFINILSLVMLMLLSKNNYITYSKIIYVITYILEMAILFMMAFDKNNRGLHDYISNTKVIENKKE